MKLKEGWHEIGSSKCDYRKGLEHCTIRLSRSHPDSEEWMVEITVGFMMVGTIRQIYKAGTVNEAIEMAEIAATENFAKLKGYYILLLKGLD